MPVSSRLCRGGHVGKHGDTSISPDRQTSPQMRSGALYTSTNVPGIQATRTVRGPVAPVQANRHSRAGGSPTGDRRFCPKSTPTAKSILIPPFDSPAHPCYRSFMTPAHSLSALSAYSAVTQSPCHRDVTVVARNVTSKSRQCLGHVTARQASPKLNVPKWHQVSRDAAMFYWAL